ncbi:Serine/threonine-protein kinase CTR1 [Auxenochlorella protothecoides]|uniref:Serine/threonine-protein kinase CTR1 n=1 Tax=Auxenochlorella protothecoides TaxID=3075 RepID=A0A087SEA2_AUXPR|nr:Serine/threonine-protein kinase CTR1 [Auxenochlorella protothecoides]KFM24056.1 Serine/threonine-protein kinase CTR1 [Auxenochlorella protothecoides]
MNLWRRIRSGRTKPTKVIAPLGPRGLVGLPAPPPLSLPREEMLRRLDSRDTIVATQAAESLYPLASEDRALAASIAMEHLSSLLALLASHRQHTQLHAAYLLSSLPGASPPVDGLLAGSQVASALTAALSDTVSPGVARGVLRALSKMLAPPATETVAAVNALVACDGLRVVAQGLRAGDPGIARRSLHIIRAASALQPGATWRELSVAGVAAPALLALLRVGHLDTQAEVLWILQCLSPSQEAAAALVEGGVEEALTLLAATSPAPELRMQASVTLGLLQNASRVPDGSADTSRAIVAFQAPDPGSWESTQTRGPTRASEVVETPAKVTEDVRAAGFTDAPYAAQLAKSTSNARIFQAPPPAKGPVTPLPVEPAPGRDVARAVAGLRSPSDRSRMRAADAACTLALTQPEALLRGGALGPLVDLALELAGGAGAAQHPLLSAVLCALCTLCKTQRRAAEAVLALPGALECLEGLARSGASRHAKLAAATLHALAEGRAGAAGEGRERPSAAAAVSPFEQARQASDASTLSGAADGHGTPGGPGAQARGLESHGVVPRSETRMGPGGAEGDAVTDDTAWPLFWREGSGCRPDAMQAALMTRGMVDEDIIPDLPGDGSTSSNPSQGKQPASAGEDDWMLDDSDVVLCKDKWGRPFKLGEGGFGIVYKGRQHGVDEVAVKKIRAERPTAAQLRTFHYEVNCLRLLCHRNIVQFYGASLHPEHLFFVTELMAGGDLYTALRRHPELLAWNNIGRKIALDVALGLNFLHTRRPPILHRDLKSPNILLTGEGVAKIADVGMSRPMSDIWSYGILIWEIVTGRDITQYQPLSLTQGWMQQGLQDTDTSARSIMQMDEGAPAMARHIFQQCTQPSPALRPAASQIVEWLRGGTTLPQSTGSG